MQSFDRTTRLGLYKQIRPKTKVPPCLCSLVLSRILIVSNPLIHYFYEKNSPHCSTFSFRWMHDI